MGLKIIRCNSRILSFEDKVGKRDKLFTYSMKCNYVTDSQYFPCLPFEPSFTGHKFPKKIVINSFLHNIKVKSSLVREHSGQKRLSWSRRMASQIVTCSLAFFSTLCWLLVFALSYLIGSFD